MISLEPLNKSAGCSLPLISRDTHVQVPSKALISFLFASDFASSAASIRPTASIMSHRRFMNRSPEKECVCASRGHPQHTAAELFGHDYFLKLAVKSPLTNQQLDLY